MKKPLKASLIALGCLAGALALFIAVSMIMYSPEYIVRILVNRGSKITDYQVFPERPIAKSDSPYHFEYALDDSLGSLPVAYTSGGKQAAGTLGALLAKNGSTSCVVVKGGKVVYEQYFNGYDRESVETSFSSVKSMDSLMIGMAIEDGFIQSVRQPISDFLPELKGTDFQDITLENLLMMRSKIRYEEGFAWFTDDGKTYYMPDLRALALHGMQVDPNYSGKFHYNNYHPLLLGLILERATKMHVADYFREKIWDKVGAEYDAGWSLDSEASGFEKMESGLNFRSIDYAKIGCMLLNGGAWNGNRVIGKEWLDQSIIAPEPLKPEDIDSDFLKGKNVGYQYMWYSVPDGLGGHDFFAAGKYGQFLYISPVSDAVVVRTGMNTGAMDWWPDVLGQVAKGAGKT
jgi:CubicO group peptidase (beta-lactamase class C family)